MLIITLTYVLKCNLDCCVLGFDLWLLRGSHIFLIAIRLPFCNVGIPMGSQIRRFRQPSADEQLESMTTKGKSEEDDAIEAVQRISLEKVSLEERRKEAKKPLYLVRYE